MFKLSPLPLLACFALTATAVSAQDFQRIAPKTIPVESKSVPLPGDPPPADGSDEVLAKHVTGILTHRSQAEVRGNPGKVSGWNPGGIELLQRADFTPIADKYLGQPLTMRSVNSLSREIVLFYRRHDRPVVDVIVPEQDITNGVLQLVVIEGRVGEVRAEGNRWFSSRLIESGVRSRAEDPIRASDLREDIQWLNQNPFRDVNVVFTPGQTLGTTDLVLKTEDRFPFRFYVGYEDSGNDLTGDERAITGFNWGNVFGLGHQLSYQFTSSSDLFNTGADIDNLRAHSISYLAPLPWHHTLLVFAGYSDSEAEATPFLLSGTSWQVGLRYTVPLPSIGRNYNHEVYGGFDWKQSDNTLDFGFIPASATTTDIGQWVLGYRSTLSDAWGRWTMGNELVWSPGSWFGHQNDAAYQAVRPGASADYSYFRLDLGRVTRLPWDFTLSHQFTAQWTTSNLQGSEQLAFGGYNSVRGYDERELNNTDEGWIIRNELRSPTISLLRLFGKTDAQDKLQFLGFFDYGSARAKEGNIMRQDGRAVASETLASIGPGLRYNLGSNISLRLDYGIQLNDVGNERYGSRWHIGVTVGY